MRWMHADEGDRILTMTGRRGTARECEVLEAVGLAGGPPFVVRWSDGGYECLLYPAVGDQAYSGVDDREQAGEGDPPGVAPARAEAA